MFYFLIVEDTKESIRSITRVLSTGFPQSNIDVARTVKDGLELIKKADKEGMKYHSAILDLKLPYDDDAEVKVDTSLCCIIKNTHPSTLVIHLTAFPDDTALRDHLIQFHLEPQDPRAAVFSKWDPAWPDKILSKLRAYLYGEYIKQQMNTISTDRSGSMISSKGCMTHDINALFRSIVEHWDYLNDQLQNEIIGLFEVDLAVRPIRISLVKDVENLGT